MVDRTHWRRVSRDAKKSHKKPIDKRVRFIEWTFIDGSNDTFINNSIERTTIRRRVGYLAAGDNVVYTCVFTGLDTS